MTVSPELKIIADHLRSSCFLVADGILPSNEGRGYVLRRIMRRAMRQIHKLGAKESTMHKLVDALIREMGEAYPELVRARAVIIETLKNEEEKFRETLENGLKLLEEELFKNFPDSKKFEEMARRKEASTVSVSRHTCGAQPTQQRSQNSNFAEYGKFSGATAFKLYDTYGFPLDLTQDILKEKNIEVDVAEFDREMEQQRARARQNWVGSGEEKEDKLFFDLKEKFGETKFLGYEVTSTKAKILAIVEEKKSVEKISYPSPQPSPTRGEGATLILLNQTPFYATSGGQVGDDGKIFLASDEKNFAAISKTTKAAGLFLHLVSGVNCELKVGDEVVAEVNQETRQNRANNHSATHLMHKALKEILGNSISQKGSNVDAANFTFDFNFNRAMTAEEKQKVENLVNAQIRKGAPVQTKLMDLEAARNSGAEALFGEKYDAEVRVVSMGNSVELCGGTHAKNTSDIEEFKIVAEFSVASGIRRIEAITGRKAVDEWRENERKKLEAEIATAAQKQKDKENEKFRMQQLLQSLADITAEKVGAVNFVTRTFDEVDAKELRELTTNLKSRPAFANNHVFAMFAAKDGKVSVIIAVSADIQEKFDASKLIAPAVEAIGGKGGGGKKDMAMGGGVNKSAIPQAVDVVKDFLK